jgi:hypothetical protein
MLTKITTTATAVLLPIQVPLRKDSDKKRKTRKHMMSKCRREARDATSRQMRGSAAREEALPSSIATPYGIEVDRCSGSFSEMPSISQQGDDWTPTGVCKDLTAIKKQVDCLLKRTSDIKKRGGSITADAVRELVRDLRRVSDRLSEARDSALDCFEEFNHANIFAASNPEISGYDILLQSAPEPPAWARKQKLSTERKRKQQQQRGTGNTRGSESHKKKNQSGESVSEKVEEGASAMPTRESVSDEAGADETESK